MSGREFVDTNIFIYAFDRTAGEKRTAAIELVDRLRTGQGGCVSMQVLQEFYVTSTRKLSMPADSAWAQVERLGKWTVHRPTFDDLEAAVQMHRRGSLSFWDAMIVRSAIRLGCEVLWSEDLADGQHWGTVVVRNPFRARSAGA